MPQGNKEKLNIRERTTVRCPQCGKRTGLRLGVGDAAVYCRHCMIEIEVTIRVIEKADSGGSANGD